jgi:hypothetical protein
MKRFLLMLAAIAALGLVLPAGCGKDDKKDGDKKADKKDDKKGDKKGADKKGDDKKGDDKKGDDKKGDDKKAEGGGDGALDTGVAECDAPYNKYLKCIMEKAPEQGRAAMVDGLKQSADAWKQAASTEEGKKALAESCKAATGAWQQSAEALGCEW